ncbi:hypothetical protein [Streptomyces violascens]|nr:hypothetical protein [Streptomyces violascens]
MSSASGPRCVRRARLYEVERLSLQAEACGTLHRQHDSTTNTGAVTGA